LIHGISALGFNSIPFKAIIINRKSLNRFKCKLDFMEEALLEIPQWVGTASVAVEIFGVAVIILGIAWASLGFLINRARRLEIVQSYDEFRIRIGKTLLLGLEILVAGDVIRTVFLEPTLENLVTLGLLVIIRTILSWTLVVEIEERWPWQKRD
jgi:uncharacterized membrane protein